MKTPVVIFGPARPAQDLWAVDKEEHSADFITPDELYPYTPLALFDD